MPIPFADYYINNISINSDGTRAIVSGISEQKGSCELSLYTRFQPRCLYSKV